MQCSYYSQQLLDSSVDAHSFIERSIKPTQGLPTLHSSLEQNNSRIQNSYLPSLKVGKSRNAQGPHGGPVSGVMKSTEFSSKNDLYKHEAINANNSHNHIKTQLPTDIQDEQAPSLHHKFNTTSTIGTNQRSSFVQTKTIPIKIAGKIAQSKTIHQALQRNMRAADNEHAPSNVQVKNKLYFSNNIIGKQFAQIQQVNNYGLPNFQQSKVSSKHFGSVKAFAANTNVGLVRQSNEDRIAIILNVIHPSHKKPVVQNWPNIQIFGIFDGHGGSKCAEYLKDHLHNDIINLPEFPLNIDAAVKLGAQNCDTNFCNMLFHEYRQKFAETRQKLASINRAGSCGLVVMIMDDDIYIINVGDSRAVMSKNHGQVFEAVTTDHKPMDPVEYKRITENGGKIYQSQTVFKNNNPTPVIQQVDISEFVQAADQDHNNPYVGPYRVAPGRLSVSRTFGDMEAKIPELGGMEGVVVCDPEITVLKNGGQEIDFVIIGSDGIFDKLSNQDIQTTVWNTIRLHESDQSMSIHQICGKCSDEILREAAKNKTMDNISIVMIGFKKLQEYLDRVRQSDKIIHHADANKSITYNHDKHQRNQLFKTGNAHDTSNEIWNNEYRNAAANHDAKSKVQQQASWSNNNIPRLKSKNILFNTTAKDREAFHLPPMTTHSQQSSQETTISQYSADSLDKRLQNGLGKQQQLKPLKSFENKRSSNDAHGVLANTGYSTLITHSKDLSNRGNIKPSNL